jgi:hypothetical protein
MLSFGHFESQARQLLARASILAEAPVSAIGSGKIKHGKPGGDAPSGNSHDLYSWLREEFGGCVGEGDFEAFCVKAESAIEAVCVSKPAPVVKLETEAQLFGRIIVEGEGFGVAEVAVSLRTTDRIVLRARKDAKRDLETGKPRSQEKASLSAAERRMRAKELRKQGWKLHEIASELDCDEATASRDLRRAA